nr:MAG TPA: tail sheath protein [Caudoviricetes sp.]
MSDTDGNIGTSSTTSTEKVTGLLFDISKQAKFFEEGAGLAVKDKLQGNVIEINSMDDLKELGITAYSGDTEKDLLFGIPYYHINHFFGIQGSTGRLFIMFADCGVDWNAIEQMQRAAHGMINQLGVWTEQSLWKQTDPEAETYSIDLVTDLQSKAASLADENAPLSILLCANSAVIATDEESVKKVELGKIPTCVINARFVSVLLGQGLDADVSAMQLANQNLTPIGNIGAALGCIASASVQESFAWVNKFNLIGYFPDIEMGFGDVTLNSESKLTSTLKYSSLNKIQLDDLDDKGYIFLCKYSGLESGVFFSKDQTCSNGDYRTVARNRTIHKSRRAVRNALLPYVNSPLKVDPSTGYLSSAKITMFQNIVSDILTTMQNNEEISGFSVTIDKNQNVLKNDTLIIKYSLVPVGVASRIEVVEGLALTNK